MDRLRVFGLCAVIAMVVCYIREPRAWIYIGVRCQLFTGSAYGFLAGRVAIRRRGNRLGRNSSEEVVDAAERSFRKLKP